MATATMRTFADGASNPAIAVAGGGVSPGSVTVSNTSTAYSFSGGGIGGGGSFTKSSGWNRHALGAQRLQRPDPRQRRRTDRRGQQRPGHHRQRHGRQQRRRPRLPGRRELRFSAEPLTLSGGGGGGGALYAVSGNNTFAGPITLAADSTIGVASAFAQT